MPQHLGRILHHDPRNKQPEHRAFAAPALLPDKYAMWYSPDVFDQASDNCTTEAAIGHNRTNQIRKGFKPNWPLFDTEDKRVAFYLQAQQYDPPEWGVHDGSATDTPFKALRARGHIAAWKWLFGVAEVKQWIMYQGSCAVGTVWNPEMFTPSKGYLQVDHQASPVGGHAYRLVGYSPKRQAFRMVNSWGKGWGQNGRAWVHEADLDWLLSQQGEAVTVA